LLTNNQQQQQNPAKRQKLIFLVSISVTILQMKLIYDFLNILSKHGQKENPKIGVYGLSNFNLESERVLEMNLFGRLQALF